jgi:hypothetical protein
MPVRDRRILLPATFAWKRFVAVEFGVSVMPGWGIRRWDVSPDKSVWFPSYGVINHRPLRSASLTRDVVC